MSGPGHHSEPLNGLLRLAFTPGVGPVLAGRLLQEFGTADRIWRATEGELLAVPGVGPGVIRKLRQPPAPEVVATELERLARLGGGVIPFDAPEYPEQLSSIHAPPVLLFTRGGVEWLRAGRMVAIVGSRHPSGGGVAVARRLARELAAAGVVVVSGGAIGIDTAAHWGALEGGGGSVAVLACGLDVDYPRGNLELRESLALQGCLVTEAALGTQPAPGLFPQRNRIISGLSHGVVVVEAALDSGAIITANHALDQGREVFAVPGPVDDPRCRGSNRLLRQGAALVEDGNDILAACGWLEHPETRGAAGGDSSSAAPLVAEPLASLLRHLSRGPAEIDALARANGLTVAELSSMLLPLEMAGVVARLPGNRLVLKGRY